MKQIIKLLKCFYHIHDYEMGFKDQEVGGVRVMEELVCECGDTTHSMDEALFKMKNSIRMFWVKLLITAFIICTLGSYTIMQVIGAFS